MWNAEPKTGQSIVYEGPCENGLAHGDGRTRWYLNGKLDSIYKGAYRAGRRHGEGVYLYPNGSRYKGEFRSGHRHGYGTREWPNGDRFTGEFRRGVRHGHGIITFADEFRFEGPYEEGKPHGLGRCFTPARGPWECRWEQGTLME